MLIFLLIILATKHLGTKIILPKKKWENIFALWVFCIPLSGNIDSNIDIKGIYIVEIKFQKSLESAD